MHDPLLSDKTSRTQQTTNTDLFHSTVPWIANCSKHNQQPAVQSRYLYENKLVEYNAQTKQQYRLDVSRSSYALGKYYYWSLTFDIRPIRALEHLDDTHPLRFVWKRWRQDIQLEARQNVSLSSSCNVLSSHSVIVVVNAVSTICLDWLSLSNQELAQAISSGCRDEGFIHRYRQSIIHYLEEVAD